MARYTDEQLKFVIQTRRDGDEWQTIAEKFNKAFAGHGPPRSWDNLRNLYNRNKYEINAEESLGEAIRSRHVARRRAGIVARESRAALDEVMSQEEFIEKLCEVNKLSPINVTKTFTPRKRVKAKRSIVAHLSDLHIGVNIRKEELGGVNEFNETVASRRIAFFFDEVAQYKIQHREETDLVVVLNGDIIAGVIHSLEGGVQDLTLQYAQAVRYLVAGLSHVAQAFNSVRVYATVGNHGRYTHKQNKGQQSDAKWDSHEMNVYIAVKEILSHACKNVSFELTQKPYVIFDVQGHTFFATHGDTVVKVGNVSRFISMEKIKNAVNEIQIGLNKKIDVLMVGHVHKQTFQTLDSGTDVLINGCLSGIDSFAQSIGLFSNNPAQQVFETTTGYAVGDVRFVRVKVADTQEKYNKIIQPTKGI